MKTHKEIMDLADIIQNETELLPRYNFAGESNFQSENESMKSVRALRKAVTGQKIDDIEVINWIHGRPSELDDYFS